MRYPEYIGVFSIGIMRFHMVFILGHQPLETQLDV